ncbi:MAG: Crp/Fnr family transcriptional regulator [Winogradskyella sp.]
MNPFVNYISKHIELSTDAQKAIDDLIPIKEFKSGHILLKEGSVSKEAFFNLKGCVRMFFNQDGEEKTTFFYTENQFITSIKSFNTHEPTSHYLECIEDCTLAILSFEAEEELLTRFPELEVFARISMQEELINYQEMLSAYIISNPEQRYLNLIKNKPELLQRVPQYQLATYLGIKPETLSRIRKRVFQKRS